MQKLMSTEVNYSSTTPVYVHGVTPKGLLRNANLILINQSNYSAFLRDFVIHPLNFKRPLDK